MTQITPIYKINASGCEFITDDQPYLIDFQDMTKLVNLKVEWFKAEEYPYFITQDVKCSLLEFIFAPDADLLFRFKNGRNDLRRMNVEMVNKFREIIDNPCLKNKPDMIELIKSYEFVKFIQGHTNARGCDANIIKNPIWVVRKEGQELLLMYCEKDTIVKLCRESYQKILNYEVELKVKLSWYKCDNGYIAAHFPGQGTKHMTIHQIITGCYGNGKGTSIISVDHLDRDPLNNTWANLRIATREEQQANKIGTLPDTKRKRNHNARDLPEGITQDMLRKGVVYYLTVYDKVNNKTREYFRVEGHPKLKSWESSKAKDVSIIDKLNAANKVVDDLKNDVFPVSFTESRGLPKFVSLVTVKDKHMLIYDKKVDGMRHNLKMVMPENYEIEVEIGRLTKKIEKKYGNPDDK